MRLFFCLILSTGLFTSSVFSQSLNEYSISFESSEPLRTKIEANVHLNSDTLYINPYCPSYTFEEGWATFIDIETMNSNSGEILDFTYLGKNKWLIKNRPVEEPVKIVYEVDLTFTTHNWVTGNEQAGFYDGEAIYLVTRSLFLYGEEHIRSRIHFNLPDSWKVSTPWEEINANSFTAENIDDLYNNTIVVGKYGSYVFSYPALNLEVAFLGEFNNRKGLVKPLLEEIVPKLLTVFPSEDKHTVLMTMIKSDRDDGEAYYRSNGFTIKSLPTPENTIVWGNLLVHELIHLWNGKLMAGENYSDRQWFSEGFTEYLSNKLLAETGQTHVEDFIDKSQYMIGLYVYFRERQYPDISLVEAGTRKGTYRFAVYNGGWVAAFIFDIMIQEASNGEKNINDYLGYLFLNHQDTPYSLEDLEKALQELTNTDQSEFFDTYISGTELMPVKKYLNKAGWDIEYVPYEAEAYIFKNKNSNSMQNHITWFELQ